MSDHKFKVLYEGLSEYQMGLIEQMKYHASRIGEVLEELNKRREVALAYTNLEQGMMWAIKAVCMEGEAKCHHEKDGFFYLRKEDHHLKSEVLDGEITFDNAEYKCKKCGAFYK